MPLGSGARGRLVALLQHSQLAASLFAASFLPSLSPQTWYFDCNQWFDAAHGDKLIERVLKPSLQVRQGCRP